MCQYIGAWLYVFGTAAQLTCAHEDCTTNQSYGWVVTPYFLGGVGFIVGAYLMAVEAAHSWVWALVPPPPKEWKNLGRWIQFLNMLGSFLFFMGGALGYYTETGKLVPWQWINGITFVGGAFVFLVEASLLTLEWLFPNL
jgi:MFS family permease